MASKVENVGH